MKKFMIQLEKPIWIFLLCLIYCLHMVEEFIFGFVPWADRYFGNFNWTQNMIGNSIYMILLIVACSLYKRNPEKNLWIGMAGVMWVLTNSFIHLSATILSGEYSPGVVTATLLYLPVGICFLVMWGKKGLLNRKNVALSFLVGGFAIMLLPTFARAIVFKAQLAKVFHFIV
jgi:hypothetical protein